MGAIKLYAKKNKEGGGESSILNIKIMSTLSDALRSKSRVRQILEQDGKKRFFDT